MKIFLSKDVRDHLCEYDCDLGSAQTDEDYELRRKVCAQLNTLDEKGRVDLTRDVADFVINALDWYVRDYIQNSERLKK